MDFRTDPSYVWNKIKILKNSWTKIKNNVTENLQLENKISDALDKICPPWVATDPNWLPPCQTNEFFDGLYTFSEFNIALDAKNIKSAPGMDGIDYEILAEIPIKYKLLLLDIFNAMHVNEEFPPDWKQAFVNFINKNNGQSVRPISLTSCISKLFETLSKIRLQ